MATTRAGRAALGDADTGSPFHVTRIRSRFDDAEREQRFFRQQISLQRKSTLAAVVAMAILTLGQIPLARIAGGATLGPGAWTLGITAAVGFVLAIAMSADRSPQLTLGLLAAAALVIPGMGAVVIAGGAEIGAQTILMVAGGVILLFFSSRLDLLGSILTALAYSGITIPAWLLFGAPVRWTDVLYTLAATALAHFAGIAEARRVHRELRSSFAQREDLRQLSAIDVLTGLANRRAFDERLDAVWRGWVSTGRTPTVLMLDIDHTVISRHSPIAAYDTPLTISIGIASARATMSAPQDLVDAADQALYRAKRDGRDCVRCEDDDVSMVVSRACRPGQSPMTPLKSGRSLADGNDTM